MRGAFTLIELLVVLVIVTLVMGVVIPRGAKMLSGYQRTTARLKSEENLSRMRARAFLELHEYNVTVDGIRYRCTMEGIAIDQSHDYD